ARRYAFEAVAAAGLDPQAHGVLAGALVSAMTPNAAVVMEALAHKGLAPADPMGWRRWADIQANSRRYLAGYASMQHYFAIGGVVAEQDALAQSWRTELLKVQPGGELIQKGLRNWKGSGQ